MHAVPTAGDLYVANLDLTRAVPEAGAPVVADLEKDCIICEVNDVRAAPRRNRKAKFQPQKRLPAGRVPRHLLL